ncbi:hypothetical protein [Nonlabens agnitus]|uniref:Uncharacterized protein n=1 Tax=Nonlabens agnitus TaxID=870484 RepID=A0A2S9WWL2_9FLAO|nr:hypothetical protein [Nonlabens agnitus]PRP67867.1 hypothetical protein BST86_12545 [Nonlabens agnitus]
MKNHILLLTVVLIAISCKNQERPALEPAIPIAKIPEDADYWTLEHLAESLKDGSYLDIYQELDMNETSMQFEEGSVRRKVMFMGEGTSNELFISFENEAPFEIFVLKRGPWRTRDGLKVGSSIEQLNEINGVPVQFAGFEWDHSGYVILGGGFIDADRYSISLSPSYVDIPEDAVNEFIGDQIYDSKDPDVEKLQLYVDRIVYKF